MELKKIDKLFYERIGDILHFHRKKRGYSLRYLSELTGISRTTLDNIEMGTTRIKPEILDEICKALEINPNFNVEVTIK